MLALISDWIYVCSFVWLWRRCNQ